MSLLTFSWQPSYPATKRRTPRLIKAQLGDAGFSAREKEGLNHNPEVWDLSFENTSQALASAVNSFFMVHKGATPFLWAAPSGTKQFTCAAMTVNLPDSGLFTLNLTFEQDFSPQP